MPEYPCPCCGHVEFSEPPGSYEICPVCFWEDDLSQLRWPDTAGGANGCSLLSAQRNYAENGASEARFASSVRRPRANERLDPEWRPFDWDRDRIEAHVVGRDYGGTYASDPTDYYYWRDRALRDDDAHRRATHERWMTFRDRKQENADYRDEWQREQCGRCRFWVPLTGTWGLDYGACTNSDSARDGRVTFEHDGCPAFADAGAWQVP